MAKTIKYNLKKEELIEKIRSLGHTHDIEKMSVRELCSKIGVSIGGFYHYFTDKSDMLIALFFAIDEYMQSYCDENFTQAWQENLLVFADGYCGYNIQSGIRMIFISNTPEMTSDGKALLDMQRSSVKIVKSCFEQAINSGEISNKYTSQQLTEIFFIVIRGYVIDWAKRNGAYDLKLSCRNALKIFLKGLTYEN